MKKAPGALRTRTMARRSSRWVRILIGERRAPRGCGLRDPDRERRLLAGSGRRWRVARRSPAVGACVIPNGQVGRPGCNAYRGSRTEASPGGGHVDPMPLRRSVLKGPGCSGVGIARARLETGGPEIARADDCPRPLPRMRAVIHCAARRVRGPAEEEVPA